MPGLLLAAALLHAAQPGMPAMSPAAPAAARPEPPIAEPWIIFFEWNSARITPAAAASLDQLLLTWRVTRRAEFEISGHADRSGSAASNLRLSRRRARATATYLVRRGIPRAALTLSGDGETRPLVETPDNVPEAQNRYVVIAGRPFAPR